MALANPTADINTGSKDANVVGKFNDFLGKVVGVFDKGVDIWKGVNERVKAIKQINEETVEPTPQEVKITQENSFFDKDDKRKILVYTGLGLGAVALLLILRKK